MSDRRQFLATSFAALAALNLPKSLLSQRVGGDVFTPASMGAYTQGILTQATFEGLIGTQFTAFTGNDGVAYMRLESVTGSGGASPARSFAKGGVATAAFRAPAASQQVVSFQITLSTGGAMFPQGSYLLDHATLGRFACFLVPSTPMGGATCSATFCYLTSPAVQLPVLPVAPVMRPAPRIAAINSPSFN